MTNQAIILFWSCFAGIGLLYLLFSRRWRHSAERPTLAPTGMRLTLLINLALLAYLLSGKSSECLGGSTAYLNGLIFGSFPMYATLEAWLAKRQNDLRNHWLWMNTALLCSLIAPALILTSNLVSIHQATLMADYINLLTTPASVIFVFLVVLKALETDKLHPSTAENTGMEFDRGPIHFLVITTLFYAVSEGLLVQWDRHLLFTERPAGFDLPWPGLVWFVSAAVLATAIGMDKLYRKSMHAQAWNKAARLIMLANGGALALIGTLGLLRHTAEPNQIIYFQGFLLWGFAQCVLTLNEKTLIQHNSSGRAHWAVLAIAIQLGAGLLPGNVFNLSFSDTRPDSAFAYTLNNSYFSVAAYFVLNAFGAQSKVLRGLQRRFSRRKHKSSEALAAPEDH